MAYIRTCVQNLGEIRRPVQNNCPSSLIIDLLLMMSQTTFILALSLTDELAAGHYLPCRTGS